MILLLVQALLMLGTGVLARRKGYNFFLWLLGGSIIGLIVLSFLPFVNKMEEGDERRSKTKRGNVIGGVLGGPRFVHRSGGLAQCLTGGIGRPVTTGTES